MGMRKTVAVAIFALLATVSVAADSLINAEDAPVDFYIEAELGFVGVLSHVYQVGSTGTEFNFFNQGGQEILFAVDRYTAGLSFADQHRIGFLYQPLLIETEVRFRSDVTIDGVTFASGTPMELAYSFPFYRLSYWFDFFPEPAFDLAAGLSIQLRNAGIRFASSDGTQLAVSQNLGIVPALNLYSRYTFPGGLRLTLDAVGFWASSAIFNGADFDFEGSILDASLRAGYVLENQVELFANFRFLGGTARGESQFRDRFWTESSQAFTNNALATLIVSLGVRIE